MDQDNNNTDEPMPFPLGSKPDEADPQRLGQKYLCKFTLDGEVIVEKIPTKTGMEYDEKPLKTVPLMPVPSSITEQHIIEMKLVHSLILTIKKRHPNRVVPMTQKEYLRAGGDTRLLKKLIETGYLKKSLVAIIRQDSGKNTGSRLCIYYTPQGRALIREKLDPTYALTEYQ